MKPGLAFAAYMSVAFWLLASCNADVEPVIRDRERPLPSIEQLQSMATRICECEMAGYDPVLLKRRFGQSIKGLRQEGFGTSSYPMTLNSTCFPEIGEAACVIDRINLVGSGEDDFVCLEAQADKLDQVWNDEHTSSQSVIAADRATQQTIRTMQATMTSIMPRNACDGAGAE